MNRIFTLLFLFSLAGADHGYSQCATKKPANVTITSIYSCNATLTWKAVSGAAYYQVKYETSSGGNWTVIPDHLMALTYTFTGLLPNKNYDFAVAAFCANGNSAGYKQVSKKTSKCSLPLAPGVVNVTTSSATISWTPQCGSNNFKIHYKPSSQGSWIHITGISASPYLLSGLLSSTSYDYAIESICGTDTSKWTDIKSFVTAIPSSGPKPNFLIIVLDDARYDNYLPTGGPSWFSSPSINRIANEGANFTYMFPTTSQCAPSRVSIYTGLYAHHNGAIDNNSHMYSGLPLVQQILKDNGYYTGFVGKYGQFQGNPTGFNWWATSDGNIYTDAHYNINGGKDTVIHGHITDIYQDFALQFLNNVPSNQHFALMYFTRVPHGPTIPRTEDKLLYNNDTMPFPTNFQKYTVNYPSYLYSVHNWPYDTTHTDSMRRIEFQCLAGVEDNVTTFLSWLEDRGILDSTMVIFTSDNGFLKGEHKLQAKQLAQEESIRLPLFIRYPAWFAPNTVYADKMAANIDLAPTILQAAGIPQIYNMDGISLKNLADNVVQKKYFFYQYSGEGGTASIRAVRSLQYKYVKHYCKQVTQEFYDLVNDPKENVNQINNSAYAALVASYQLVMDSIETAVGDYKPVNVPCSLSNPQNSKEDDENEAVNDRTLRLWPNPAPGYFLISFNEAGTREDIVINVTDVMGNTLFEKEILNAEVLNTEVFCHNWLPGVYLVTLQKGEQVYTENLVISR